MDSSNPSNDGRVVPRLAVGMCVWGGLIAGPVAAQTQPGTEAGFEIHGRLLSGSAPAGFGPGDGWAQGAAFLGVLDDQGQAVAPFNAQRRLDPNWGNQGDGHDPTTFSGSSNKNDDLIGSGQDPWTWGGGNGGPKKNDITNTYFHTRVSAADGHRWVFLGAETRSTSGDSHVDFEFNQAGIEQVGATGGFLVGHGLDGGRTTGDLIISIDFRRGGGAPGTTVREWDGNTFVPSDVPGAVVSATNFGEIVHGTDGAWKHFAENGAETTIVSPLQLVEAGIDLTALGVELNVCSTAATFTVKTRSSASFTSALKDFVLVPFPLEDPPVASAANGGQVCLGAQAQLFAGPDDLGYAWTGPDGFTSIEQNPIVPVAMPGDYCVTVTEAPGCEDTACTQIPFLPSPDCLIVGDETVCAGSSCNVYDGPPGGRGSSPPVGYKWKVFGNGEINGPNNLSQVSVDPVALRAVSGGRSYDGGPLGSYTLTLETTDAEGCTSECSLTVLIIACQPGEGSSCEGCSPGFWRQPNHFSEWPALYHPDDLFAATGADGVFFEDAFAGMTLEQVLQAGGGALNALGRQTVAALLNAASPGLNYPLPPDLVVTMFNDVFPGSDADYLALKDLFEGHNLQGCPLGN